MNLLSGVVFVICALAAVYWFLLAVASLKSPRQSDLLKGNPTTKFAILIAAHNEESVIERTVSNLLQVRYPKHLFAIYVVADHCEDQTSQRAIRAGAQVHERNMGSRTGKGAALSWLLTRVCNEDSYDAVIVFDADTLVDHNFLTVMDSRLRGGDDVVQGQHVVSNAEVSWFSGLAWVMFLIDNLYQNAGRTNLGWSAKNMGDSICLRINVIGTRAWVEGFVEDQELRQRLLLDGIKIKYERRAIGYGEAALTWAQARVQRTRWLEGGRVVNRKFGRRLFVAGIKRRDLALLDGAMQAFLPSYCTITLMSLMGIFLQVLLNAVAGQIFSSSLIKLWSGLAIALFIYPFPAIIVERVKWKAYWLILTGPLFILWRTCLILRIRLGVRPTTWIRTAHGGTR